MLKKIGLFLLFLIPWFFSGFLFYRDTSFYQTLHLPFFAPSPIVFQIVWIFLYILIAYSTTIIYLKYGGKDRENYTKTLIGNYLFNQLYGFFFFVVNHLFLSFVDTVCVFVTSLFLYYETKDLDKKASNFLLPYVFWNLFAVILSLVIYFMNL